MYAKPVNLQIGLVILLSVGGIMAAGASAQEVLHLYGPLGLNPAIEDAAVAYAARNDVKLEVVTGPTSEWSGQAKNNGDLVYCTGEFIMSDFVRSGDVPVDEASVRPRYLRPSAILVRPDNPKDIRDFPDLLRPGMRVMLVNGSGKTGLWENMTGKLQSLTNLVALQKNIVLCAAGTDEAMKAWRERNDIDAWLTWNVWHMPRRDSAMLVPISKDYLIYRECSISLTERGKQNQLAAGFVDFLASREGAGIFNSWGWMRPPADVNPAIVDKGICVACRIRQDSWTNSVGRGLDRIRRLVDEYKSLGIPRSEIHICAVVDGDASYWLLKDKSYGAFTSKEAQNPNRSIVEELLALGVSVEVSAESIKAHGWTKDDILPGVKIVSGADPRLADLAEKGYDYLPI